MNDQNIDTYEELANHVAENNGIATVSMRLLAGIHGVGRLGKHVRSNMATSLRGKGLGYYPGPKLPNSQSKKVRLFKHDTPAGKLIKSVLAPDEEGDERIRSIINQDAEATVQRIQELVCE